MEYFIGRNNKFKNKNKSAYYIRGSVLHWFTKTLKLTQKNTSRIVSLYT